MLKVSSRVRGRGRSKAYHGLRVGLGLLIAAYGLAGFPSLSAPPPSAPSFLSLGPQQAQANTGGDFPCGGSNADCSGGTQSWATTPPGGCPAGQSQDPGGGCYSNDPTIDSDFGPRSCESQYETTANGGGCQIKTRDNDKSGRSQALCHDPAKTTWYGSLGCQCPPGHTCGGGGTTTTTTVRRRGCSWCPTTTTTTTLRPLTYAIRAAKTTIVEGEDLVFEVYATNLDLIREAETHVPGFPRPHKWGYSHTFGFHVFNSRGTAARFFADDYADCFTKQTRRIGWSVYGLIDPSHNIPPCNNVEAMERNTPRLHFGRTYGAEHPPSRTIRIPTVDDNMYEPDGTITVRLNTSYGANNGFGSLPRSGGLTNPISATVKILDNDGQRTVSVTSDQSVSGVTEGPYVYASAAVRVSPPVPVGETVTVPVTVTQSGDVVYTASDLGLRNVVLAATTQTGPLSTVDVSVLIEDDSVYEPSGAVTFALGQPRAGPGSRLVYKLGTPRQVTVPVHNNDRRSVWITSDQSASGVVEGPYAYVYATVHVSTAVQVGESLSVPVTVSETGDVIYDHPSETRRRTAVFKPVDKPIKSVRLSGVLVHDDNIDEATGSIRFTVNQSVVIARGESSSFSTPLYNLGTPRSVSVPVYDDDCAVGQHYHTALGTGGSGGCHDHHGPRPSCDTRGDVVHREHEEGTSPERDKGHVETTIARCGCTVGHSHSGDLADCHNHTPPPCGAAPQTYHIHQPGTGTVISRTKLRCADYPGLNRLTDISIAENGGTAQIDVTLTGNVQTGETGRVSGQTRDGTAEAPHDYSPAVFGGWYTTIPAGSNSARLGVTIRDDRQPEGNETFSVSVRGSQGVRVQQQDLTVTIIDNDTTPAASVTSAGDLIEGRPAVFNVRLDRPYYDDVTVVARVTETGDMLKSSLRRDHKIRFPAGSTQQQFVLSTLNDTADEPDSTITVAIQPPARELRRLVNLRDTGRLTLTSYNRNIALLQYTRGRPHTARAKVVDNDLPLPVISVSATDTTITEGQQIAYTVSMRDSDRRSVPVRVKISVTEASNGAKPADHLPDNDQGVFEVTIPARGTSVSYVMLTDDDSEHEDDSTVTISVQPDPGYAGTSVAEVVVLDNDPEFSEEQCLEQAEFYDHETDSCYLGAPR